MAHRNRNSNTSTTNINMLTLMSLLILAFAPSPTQSAKGCFFQQTGGCDPKGIPESKLSCSSKVPKGASGYCECGDSLGTRFEVTCEHHEFNCEDGCYIARKRDGNSPNSNANSPESNSPNSNSPKSKQVPAKIKPPPFDECYWMQTGGCDPNGNREPQSDQVGWLVVALNE